MTEDSPTHEVDGPTSDEADRETLRTDSDGTYATVTATSDETAEVAR